jgi:hypothetical protein
VLFRRLVPALLLAAVVGGCTSPSAEPTKRPRPGPTTPAGQIFDPSQLPECQYPESVRMPKWIPKDLPLPPGTYATQRLDAIQGYRRSLLVVQRTVDQLADYVLERFPEEGWIVGRGDTEPGEVDLQFSKAPAVGAFRALDQFCRPGFALVLMIYAPDRAAIEAPVPITPNPGASPIG